MTAARITQRGWGGLFGHGMHDFVLRELEVGERAALAEDDEACGFGPLLDASYAEYLRTCRERMLPGTPLGGTCGTCGHASILHPSSANPALEACLVCQLEKAVRDLT